MPAMLPSLNQLKLPDVWQHQAVNLLREGSDVVVSAPTGAGKTYIFELLHQSGHFKGQAVYTVPTRALANDKYAEWKDAKWNVGIATGDVSENVDAPVVVATLETQLERLVRGEGPALLVIDEYQMIADVARGSHYEGAIALAGEETRLLLLSGSVANPEDVAQWLRRLGRPAQVVETRERPVPLEEAPFETLPQRMGRQFDNYWPKFVASALLADLAPLLIFSPRRRDAESIARRLAADLPPGEPLELTHEQRAVCGKELCNLLEKRVAFHHSGLSYAARAGVIEPLAKAGQLRVIAATMGLAAGINFSVRSVHVAAMTFHDGRSEHRLSSDELLQMYGRAGRRGLDEKGWVITTKQSPSLMDARAARLSRASVLAWPLFLRVMKHAALTNECPFEAAERFAERLFAKVPPPLGLEGEAPPGHVSVAGSPDVKALFGLEAMERQILNSAGEWERRMGRPLVRKPLREVYVREGDRGGLATEVAAFVSRFAFGLGRVFKIASPEGVRYGVEVPLGKSAEENEGELIATKSLRKILSLPRRQITVPLIELEGRYFESLAEAVMRRVEGVLRDSAPPILMTHSARDGLLHARFDLSELEVLAYEDSHHHFLFAPEERVQSGRSEAGIETPSNERREPLPGSPIHAWRTLGLIDAAGAPTRRGEIFSFFQHGEGLAVAAALEDEGYPVEELIQHCANLRAGSKFELPYACGSERLSAACRGAYGFINHHGYLENGLPVDYGEGAAELLGALLHPELPEAQEFRRGVAEGDLSRAYVEWLSLLRHITHAPPHSWGRWLEFQGAARQALKQHGKVLRHLFHLDLPPLTNKQRHGKVRHFFLK